MLDMHHIIACYFILKAKTFIELNMNPFKLGSSLSERMEEFIGVLSESAPFKILKMRVVIWLIKFSCEGILLPTPVVLNYQSTESFTLFKVYDSST